MQAILLDKWTTLSERERILISAMLMLVALVILWLAVYRPLIDARLSAENTFRAAAREAAEIEAAAAFKASRQDSQSNETERPVAIDEAAIRSIVAQTTKDEGLTLTRLQPDTGSGGLTVWFDDVRADQILTWVRALNTQHGIRVERASIQRSGEAAVRAQFLLVPAGA